MGEAPKKCGRADAASEQTLQRRALGLSAFSARKLAHFGFALIAQECAEVCGHLAAPHVQARRHGTIATVDLSDRCCSVGAVVLLIVVGVGCGPKTATRDIDLDVSVMAGSKPGEVVVVGEGRVCEGKLSIDVEVDSDDRTIVLSGRGRVPDNRDGYCYRYIDTGGGGTIGTEKSKAVILEPDVWVLRAEDGDSSIEFDTTTGAVESSFPYATLTESRAALEEQRALEPQRQATEVITARLAETLAEIDVTSSNSFRCEFDDELDDDDVRFLTSCVLDLARSPANRTLVGEPLIPESFFNDIGCARPQETAFPDKDWTVDCDVVVDGYAGQLTILGERGEYRNRDSTGSPSVGSYWGWGSDFVVWVK